MSKYWGRINTKALKYEVSVSVKTVSIELPLPADIWVVFKRGPRRAETKAKVRMDKDHNIAHFTETLSLLATLYKSTKKNTFQIKKGKIVLEALTPAKKTKVVGVGEFDISDLAQEQGPVRKLLKLHKCHDKNATIEVEIKCTWINTIEESEDAKSMFSDLASNVSEDNEADEDWDKAIGKKKVETGPRIDIIEHQEKVMLDPSHQQAREMMEGRNMGGIRREGEKQRQRSPIATEGRALKTSTKNFNTYSASDIMSKKPPSGPRISAQNIAPATASTNILLVPASPSANNSDKNDSGSEQDSQRTYLEKTSEYKKINEKLVKSTSENIKLRNKLIELEKERTELLQEREEGEREIESAVRENLVEKQDLLARIKALEEECDGWAEEKERFEEELLLREKECSQYKRKTEAIEAVMAERDIRISEVEETNKQIEGENKEYLIEVERLKERAEVAEQQNGKLKASSKLTANEILKYKNDNEQLSANIQSLRTQLFESREKVEKGTTVVDATFIEYKCKTEIMVEDLNQQIKDLKENESNAMSQANLTLVGNQQLKSYNERREADLLNEISLFKQREQTLKKQIDEYSDNLINLKSQIAHSEVISRGKIEELEFQLNSTKSEKASLLQRKNEIEESNKNLKTKVRTLEQEKYSQFLISGTERKSPQKRGSEEYNSLENELSEKNKSLEQVTREKEDLEKEIHSLHRQNIRHSDILTGNEEMLEEIKYLQQQILEKEEDSYKRINGLTEDKKHLQQELKTAKESIKKEEKIESPEIVSPLPIEGVGMENEYLKSQVEEYEQKLRDFEDNYVRKGEYDMTDKSLKLLVHKLKAEKEDSEKELKGYRDNYVSIENQLITAKMSWANVELERETLSHKLKEKQELSNNYATRLSKFEIDLVRAKQDLGEALNAAYEYEKENRNLNDRLIESGKTPITVIENEPKPKKKSFWRRNKKS